MASPNATIHDGEPALAKEEEEAAAEKYRKEADATIKILGPLTFAIVTGGQLLNQSRPALVRSLVDGNQAKAANMLSYFAGLGGAAEFVLNPIIGRLSDKFGRRPLLLLSPVVCAILRGAVSAFPRANVIMFERMLSSAVVTGFFSTMRASLNDKLKGKDLVVASGAMGVYAGMGVILGPFVEVLILKALGPRANFAAVSLLNVVVGILMHLTMRETLPLSERKPVNLKDCSPLTFLGMAQVGSVNIRLMLILLLQSFGELRIMQDINMLFLRDNLQWSASEISGFMSTLGASVTVGGKTIKTSLSTFGMRGHTTLSNIAMAIAFFAHGMGSSKSTFFKYYTQFFALMLWFIGGRKRDAVETNCTEITLQGTNMGKGQVASALSNFKSLAAIFGPPISAKLYARGLANNNPGLPYFTIGVCYLFAELVHSSMSSKQMGIKDGQ